MRGSNGHYLQNSPNPVVPGLQQPAWNFPSYDQQPFEEQSSVATGSEAPVTIKIPPMAPSTRSSARQRVDSNASGSEYLVSSASMDVDDQDVPEDEEETRQQVSTEFVETQRGRRIVKMSYKEADSEDELNILDQKSSDREQLLQENGAPDGDGDEGSDVGGYHLRRRPKSKLNGIVESDDEGQATVSRYETRSRSRPSTANRTNGGGSNSRHARKTKSSRNASNRSKSSRSGLRRARSGVHNEQDEDVYIDESGSSSGSADASLDEAPGTTPEPEHDDLDADGDADAEGEPDQEPEQDGRKYALRRRVKINYAIPPPLEEMKEPAPKPRSFGRTNSRGGGGRAKAPGWSASGAELSRWMGGEDSVRQGHD